MGLNRAGRGLAGVLVVVLSGCSSAGGQPIPCATATDRSACLEQRYFLDYDQLAVARCAPVVGLDQLDATLAVGLYFGQGLSDPDVVAATTRMQRFYSPYGLRFAASEAAAPAPLSYAMNGSRAEIEAALARASIPLDRSLATDEALVAHRVVGQVVFANLRAFVASHAADATNRLDVVVVDRIVEPELAEYMYDSSMSGIVGFGLSPTMLDRLPANDQERELYDIVGLPAQFRPVLFVGVEDLRDAPERSDSAVAHEAGHALGLVHSDDPTNLMYPFPDALCDPALSADQLADLAATLRD